jgi:hypothetical protein
MLGARTRSDARPPHAPISESADGAYNDSADDRDDGGDGGNDERAPKRARVSARAADEPALTVPVPVAAANLYDFMRAIKCELSHALDRNLLRVDRLTKSACIYSKFQEVCFVPSATTAVFPSSPWPALSL